MSLVHLIIAIWLLTISILDIKSRRVSAWLLAIGGAVILLAVFGCSEVGEYLGMLKGMLPGILLLAVAFFTGKAGYGDGIVLLVLGAASKGKGVVLLGTSLFLISIFSIVLLVLRKANRNTRIPYLPFLAAAWLLTINL